MTVSFWANNHPLSPLAQELSDAMIPASGPTRFVESEVLRAVMRLHYDYFNNGFGNNMSQAVAYIEFYYLPLASAPFCSAFARIREEALAPTRDDTLDDDFITVMAEVLIWVRRRRDTNFLTPRDREIFDMPSRETIFPEYEYEEEDDD